LLRHVLGRANLGWHVREVRLLRLLLRRLEPRLLAVDLAE